MRVLQINSETSMLTSAVPIPLLGVLPVNAYVIRGEQPTLIDTGITPERDDFIAAVRDLVDPKDLRWIVLTHADHDHIGAIIQLLDDAPNARVVATFATVGVMSIGAQPIPPERALVVRDGSTVDIGDRTLTAIRPPLFDNPGTVGIFDPKQNILFSSDCFGAPFASPESVMVEDVAMIPEDELQAAQLLWGSFDSPWAHFVEDARLADNLAAFVAKRPERVLSTHLPPILGDLDRHVKTLSMLPSSTPAELPDQAALEAFMAQMQQ